MAAIAVLDIVEVFLYVDSVLVQMLVSQREFVEFFNSSVSFLQARYGDEYVAAEGSTLRPITDENSPSPVHDIYIDGIADNIEYLKSGEEARRVDFIAKSEYAYRTLWRSRVKKKRVKGDVW